MESVSTRTIEEQYTETIRFLYSLERFGILLGLENILNLLQKMGNPQKEFPSVHVAGSNGKGSTSSFIFNILQETGLKTALYTSPHLNDFRERIRLNDGLVPKDWMVESVEKVKLVYDPTRTTFFEFTTAMAFDCIARSKPDIAVVEVGLGGRLDATNTINPLVGIITDISREHEDYLGVGIESITREKAGIIKPGVPLVTGASRSAARKVIREIAYKLSIEVREFGRDFFGIRTKDDRFTYRSDLLHMEDLQLAMPGSHQIKNASLAVAAIEQLMKQGRTITEDAVRRGLLKTRFSGRFELLRRAPDVIIDGAHTPEGMRYLKSTFKRKYPGIRPLMLLGMLRDKNYDALINIIAPLAREIICVPPQGNRALDGTELQALVRKFRIPVEAAPEIEVGFRMLMDKVSSDDVILAAGSLYMIGPVRRCCGLPD